MLFGDLRLVLKRQTLGGKEEENSFFYKGGL